MNVALFVPCYVDLLYPQVGKAVVRLLRRLGIPFDYPMEQTCCGQPAFNAGFWPEARKLALRFASVFSDYDKIVVPSGSCAATAAVFFAQLDAPADVVAVGKRVRELSQFLVEDLGLIDVGARFAHRVTYHDG